MGRKDKYRWQGNALVKVEGSGQGISGPASGSDTFTCAVDNVTACSRGAVPTIYIDSRLWQSIVALCDSISTEWLAYLIGEKDEAGDYEVKSLSFPEQAAGGAHVREMNGADFRAAEGTIGAIHSHVRMQAFFSPTDVNHANWPVEIVVNARGEYETSVRVTLPCGETMRKKSSIALLTGGILPRLTESLKEALEKGKAKEEASRPAQPAWPYRDGNGHGWGGGAYGASRQDDSDTALVLGKFFMCPICGQRATRCRHSGREMELHVEKQEAQKQVAS